ncbi:MAG TPA: radical SAM protein [Candidatus Onthousia excrementipullorum]|uniref:Radical SAM protein n=1 Tax=Candidatus Onthousia excrementipullorum TaxID=2840884 RepID=A0A9D1DUB5_9FIRM|nr:radical SAM protein [Candidatus Onthousia excrementipullorum]
MLELYKKCNLCPRNCLVDRTKTLGYCKATDKVKVARSALHYFEEPSISGSNGSGTIFFSNCNLKCCYCQNKEISTDGFGKEITIERLSEMMLELEEKHANNINLVTPTHYVPSIIEAIKLARKKGLSIPIVYNTSGYESVETLKLLEGYIDIYLTDFKYFDNKLGKYLSKCSNYFEVASKALEEMYRQTGKNIFNKDGLMTKGIIVRCLVLPTKSDDTKKIINYLYKKYQDNIYLSIMNQYTPVNFIKDYPYLNKTISEDEYNDVIDYAIDLGIKNAYMQEGGTCSESFIPAFDLEGV